MTTMTLAPTEQLSHRHVHGNSEDHAEGFSAGISPDPRFASPHSLTRHPPPYGLPTVYVSHPLTAVPMGGDGRPMANIGVPQNNAVPVSVPLGRTLMYPGFSNCPTVFPTATRGSYTSRRPSGGSGEFSTVETPADDASQEETPESGKVLQEVCRYFMRTGTCGYGDKCRYHHPQSAHRPKLNSMGYPQREAEHACPFYLKNGWCGFGATCKFNHPELPPLNVPTAATLMPQILTHVPYPPTIPPPSYASVSPGGTYSAVAPAPPATPMMHWSVAPPGVPMNVSPPPQSGMYQSYMSLPPAVPAWPVSSSKEQQSMPLGSYGTPSTAQKIYAKGNDGHHQDTIVRHTSPKSEDSAFSVVGRDVSLRRHHTTSVETKHGLMPMHPVEDASHVSVTTA